LLRIGTFDEASYKDQKILNMYRNYCLQILCSILNFNDLAVELNSRCDLQNTEDLIFGHIIVELSDGRENLPTRAAQEWPSFADSYTALYITLNLIHVMYCQRVNSDNFTHQQPFVVSCGQRAAILHGLHYRINVSKSSDICIALEGVD
jgi:hypothetical protein